MSRRWNSQGSWRVRYVDIEKQLGPKNDGTGSEKKATKMPWWFQYFHWDVMFLVLCIVAIAVDPLFFYLPVIKKDFNEATKCITIDNTLKIIAICVRSFLDLVALGDLVASRDYIMRSDSSDYVINILAILPLPQVLVPITFSEMRGWGFRHERKFLIAVVLLQYVPRLFRIYRLWKTVNVTIILPKSFPSTTTSVKAVNAESYKKGFIVMKAGFNLFLYLVASHVLGAFWYFFSIERETLCWQKAYKNHYGNITKSTSFRCGHGSGNIELLNDYCPLEKNTNTSLSFDFGIFQEARQSGILEHMDIPRKTMLCFWWGLRNLSSLGQNLETSPYYWENGFAVLVSIFGLLLFLYFIGNLQVYMQWETSNELKDIFNRSKKATQHHKISKRLEKSTRHNKISKRLEKSTQHNKISKRLENSNSKLKLETYKRYYFTDMDEEDKAKIIRTKLRSIESWISTIGLSYQLQHIIKSYVTPLILEDQKKDLDTENPFPHLPTPLGRLIKLHLCLPLLRTVPVFENESEELLNEITCKFLKQVQYNQNSNIVREGEPLDAMIFVVKGIVWTYTSNHDDKTGCLKKGDIFGRNLVEWVLKTPELSNLPLSTMTLKCHTKVEAFCLMAGDLKDMMSQYWWRFSHITQSDSEQLKHFAASSTQAAWRRKAIQHPH